MRTFRILDPSDHELYLDHIRSNFKNSRNDDPNLLDKFNMKVMIKPSTKIFALLDDSKIIASIFTSKKIFAPEFHVINYRTSGNAYFKKQDFLDLFGFVFDYYESIGYYRWVTIRPIDLFGKKFVGISKDAPFDRYETVIEYAPVINTDTRFYYHHLFDGIPESTKPEDYLLIVGMCKQEFRKLFSNLNFV